MRGSVLFVCSANVCRSPLMQYSFLEAVPEATDWDVASAGVAAREGAPPCSLSLSLLQEEDVHAQAATHRATQLDRDQLQADLVIVASRAERATIAQHSPDVRWRVFTLAEAVYLGRSAGQHYPGEREQPGTVAQYAQMLDSQRGMLVLPRPRNQRRYLSGLEQPHPLDISDGHQLRRRAHTRTLRRIRTEITEFSSLLAGFVAAVEQ
ncbi:arsenate reductase/protein-tyrosine-phosphatase family protein [Leucobacter salsicius]|uniref:arsenate reductase/protein-tyrosine-phosphatase family protein n=1 Tax=Leucobacter salsicius TaxID=664638 RepID=UPI00037F9E91|nr:hypothetical protein [Leucobacter salsicius]